MVETRVGTAKKIGLVLRSFQVLEGAGLMSATWPWSGTPQPPPMNDPNELLNRVRRIDQTTTQMFHWVRIGVVALIVLAIVIILIG